MKKFTIFNFQFSIILFLFFILYSLFFIPTAKAVVDPLSVPNNRFGIHIITASKDEASPAADLVNNKGDWGYITVVIERKDRNKDKWQEFFNDLRRRHLIPIVRLATEPSGALWKRPDPDEAQKWADFLDSLNWPTKNRYVIVYNEPNHGQEWEGEVDAKGYAKILNQTIDALKAKNEDFFVLNAGLDASAPQKLPNYQDEVTFLEEMNQEVPGIFDKLDGWVSHSYPNPEFSGSPDASGRGTIRTWLWETQQLRSLGVKKTLPVFITETGWKHAEGLSYDKRYPKAEVLDDYYHKAFSEAWNISRIVAVTPFLLNYQEYPFDHFSFKTPDSEREPHQHLAGTDSGFGTPTPIFYPQYDVLKEMPKVFGRPTQIVSAQLQKGEVYSSIVAGETYSISITFKNTGQSIWNDSERIKLVALTSGKELGIADSEIPAGIKIEPGEEYTFQTQIKAPQKGSYNVKLNLFSGDKEFQSKPISFNTEVKLPVILQILANLQWKDNFAGDYILSTSGVIGDLSQKITLDQNGQSPEIEARHLLPDYAFDFTLEKAFYHPVTIHKVVKPGLNTLDFGTLEPALLEAITQPKQLWQLLPFSK